MARKTNVVDTGEHFKSKCVGAISMIDSVGDSESKLKALAVPFVLEGQID